MCIQLADRYQDLAVDSCTHSIYVSFFSNLGSRSSVCIHKLLLATINSALVCGFSSEICL